MGFEPGFEYTAVVDEVVDGDTFDIVHQSTYYDGVDDTIRHLGIDTPETGSTSMHVLVRYELADFDKWKQTVDDRAAIRAEHGCLGSHLFTRAGNDRKAVVLAEWDSAERAEAYFDSADFRRAMQDAGVERKPDVTLLEHVDDSGASSERDMAAGSGGTPSGE